MQKAVGLNWRFSPASYRAFPDRFSAAFDEPGLKSLQAAATVTINAEHSNATSMGLPKSRSEITLPRRLLLTHRLRTKLSFRHSYNFDAAQGICDKCQIPNLNPWVSGRKFHRSARILPNLSTILSSADRSSTSFT